MSNPLITMRIEINEGAQHCSLFELVAVGPVTTTNMSLGIINFVHSFQS